ncbi:acyl--CoA ligase [Aquimarina sp. TRL1]|uniref:class I adenylate-forming enzyme family protein n=1 Tax=Aquimarina sp. (strain TRL1) TaxID=2736252 RepID=UPI00158B3F93|nr:class I adenylate-forming enzyme family protein [Aquimarina sp. TRL1]QKX06979.1 acyl--CoA ligase [Aquimarina sp. TRL1]
MRPLLHNFLKENAQSHPAKVAVTMAKKEYTFNDINTQSDQIAAYLQKAGVKRGDRVVILLGNTVYTVTSFWAILKAGAVVIPVGMELKPEKIEYILQDSGATVLITNKEVVAQNKEMLESTPLFKVIMVDETKTYKENLYANMETVLADKEYELSPVDTISIDLSAIIYTSGSTGEPKGVMLTHENMVTATNSLNAYLGYTVEDKVLCALPLSFDYGLYQMIMCISTGATLVLEKEFTWPIFLLKSIIAHQVTILPAVPTMVMLLHEQNKKSKLDLSSVRAVTNTGAALTETNIGMVKNLFSQAKIFSMYGLTECKRCTYLPPEDIDKKPNSVGIAIPNTELWLVDDDGFVIKEPNQIGQLVIRGATVMRGYWNKPEKTAEKLKEGLFPGEKVLYTGDYCSLDEDGYLYFKGRMDHMIKSRGIKVSPKEVEDYISNIPEINSVLVTGVPDEDYGEVLFAFVVLEEGKQLSKETIIALCKQDLEAYKVPEYVSIITSMPKTPNGKFDVIKLKNQALEDVKNNVKA